MTPRIVCSLLVIVLLTSGWLQAVLRFLLHTRDLCLVRLPMVYGVWIYLLCGKLVLLI